jgi:hypothetical protein
LRVGDTYVDPLVLFRPPDLTKVVHLAPSDDPALASVAHERRGVLAGLRDGVHAIGRAIGGTARAAARVAGGAVTLTAAAAARIERYVAMGAHGVAKLAALLDEMSPLPTGLDAMRAARQLVQWGMSLRSCDHHAPDADGSGGSGHRVMVVAGLDSHRSAHGPSATLPVGKLGYARDEVAYYSYAAGGGAYGPDDTLIPIERAAKQLADQLRAMQRSEPGREVDLVAHSQGGVVVLAFLALEYDPGDRTLPPLGTTVTISSPLHGAPLAMLANLVASSERGRDLLERFHLAGPSLRDLEAHSDLLDRLDGAPLPPVVELTTIGAAADYVVPASRAHRRGAARFDADPVAVAPHGAVLNDAGALRAVRAALEGRRMPCQSLGEAVDSALFPTLITRIEGLGPIGAIRARSNH